MERKFEFEYGQFYHVFNRGVEKRPIFLDDIDRERFQCLLYLSNGSKPFVFKRLKGDPLDWDRGATITSIISYALMGNHFHIVACEDSDNGLSTFMGKLSTAYSMYFNTKYQRSGALLCHPFRARHIHFDDYFRWIMSYVHLNPLDIFSPEWKSKKDIDADKALGFLASYKYSSYGDYFGGDRRESKIIAKYKLPIELRDLESVGAMLEEYKSPPEDCVTDVW